MWDIQSLTAKKAVVDRNLQEGHALFALATLSLSNLLAGYITSLMKSQEVQEDNQALRQDNQALRQTIQKLLDEKLDEAERQRNADRGNW